ncbi:hypothetical protein HPB49_025463 [Dermacentor silvarum]|uniref:Uncharacterized protein n=1 Tax=Dermacentor silvarum TaxID=543639 RepID=A0ACB8CNQ0_DERSI|nr:hypothetical protein HPB49_025463 [Dermacentor silvarum]
MGISAGNLAELLADQFAARPLALQAPPTEAAARSIPSSYHHADSGTGALPESWLVAVVTPILKSRKPAIALSSYGPVLLIFAACKAVERVALARLEWIAAQLPYFPEQQTGFRCQRCTADFISDESAGVTLEDAKATGDVAMLVLLDVQSAFDGLPHAVIEACLDRLHFCFPDRQNLPGSRAQGYHDWRPTGFGAQPFPIQHGSRGPSRISRRTHGSLFAAPLMPATWHSGPGGRGSPCHPFGARYNGH